MSIHPTAELQRLGRAYARGYFAQWMLMSIADVRREVALANQWQGYATQVIAPGNELYERVAQEHAALARTAHANAIGFASRD